MQTDDCAVQIELSEIFLKDIKDLAKSYRSVRSDILPLIERLSTGEIVGDRLNGFDYQIYKVRVRNSNNNKGSSGGYRGSTELAMLSSRSNLDAIDKKIIF